MDDLLPISVYDEPCLLVCFHSFCAKCLRVRVVDGRLSCTICSGARKVPSLLPPSAVAASRSPPRHGRRLVLQATARARPLCERCKNETHRAKMFSMHEVMTLSERSCCAVHNEPHIMFSTDKKELLCINCFREYSAESKLHCVDLDTAYSDSVRRLERTVVSIRELQNSVRDGIILYRALLDEVRHNMEAEKTAVATFCRQLHETVSQLQERLLADVEGHAPPCAGGEPDECAGAVLLSC
ncbi:RING finger protein 207-like [Pollicipes pollicipes]|uniref:RING finger protein 207-like n=1 Tax=Pollicipes pollicipes TaxID=41117 RepID=UPI0018851F5B|nr:RING finger protein 207-like [Pollicipes pollicipes]